MLFEIQSEKTIDQVGQDLEKAVVDHKFEVCNPQQAKKVLEKNMRISTVLPCRISVFTEGGKVKLATLKPTALISQFNVPELQSVAKEVEDTIIEIMKDASA